MLAKPGLKTFKEDEWWSNTNEIQFHRNTRSIVSKIKFIRKEVGNLGEQQLMSQNLKFYLTTKSICRNTMIYLLKKRCKLSLFSRFGTHNKKHFTLNSWECHTSIYTLESPWNLPLPSLPPIDIKSHLFYLLNSLWPLCYLIGIEDISMKSLYLYIHMCTYYMILYDTYICVCNTHNTCILLQIEV